MKIYPSLLVSDSLRYWKRKPMQALLCVLLLAIGSAAVAILWTITSAIVLKPLPYPDSHELYGVQSLDEKKGKTINFMSLADFRDMREQQTSFTGLFAYRADFLNFQEKSGTTRQLVAARVTRDFVNVLGIRPEIGRFFNPEDFASEESSVAVISHKLWKSEYGMKESVIGESMWGEDTVYQIIGVMPKVFNEPQFTDVWTTFPDVTGEYFVRDSQYWNVVGRLKSDVSLAQAEANVAQIAKSLAEDYPGTNRNRGAKLDTLQNMIVGDYSTPIFLIFSAVSLVMFATCLNLANLQLISGLQRRGEVGIRQAIGESHHQAFSRVLMESCVVCLVGCLFGCLLAWAVIANIESILPAVFLPRLNEVGLSASLIWAILAIALIASVSFGLFPAIQAARMNTNEILKSGESRHGLSAESRRSRNLLLALQIAVAVVILNGALLVVSEYKRLQSLDLGFREENMALITVSPGESRMFDFEELSLYYGELVDWVGKRNGVVSSASTSSPPLWGFNLDAAFELQGRNLSTERDESVMAMYNSVSNNYLDTMGIKVLEGRGFSEWDNQESQRVAIVNQAFVDEFLEGADPLSQQVQTQTWMVPEFRQVVGVIANFTQGGLTDAPKPQILVPSSQSPWLFTTMVARMNSATESNVKQIEAEMKQAYPDIGISVTTINELLERQLGIQSLLYVLFLGFGFATLLLSLFGVGSQMAFNVSERQREWGIRLALGANVGQLNGLVLKKLVSPMSTGVVVGLLLFAASSQVHAGFGSALSTEFFASSTVMVFAIVSASFLTTWLISSRMTKASPQEILKSI